MKIYNLYINKTRKDVTGSLIKVFIERWVFSLALNSATESDPVKSSSHKSFHGTTAAHEKSDNPVMRYYRD